jgi:3-hydroxyacyl-[acyl-carrier-protein] dehydratase
MSETPSDRGAGLNIQEILSWLPHRYPFLLVDRVLEMDPGKRAVALKCVSVNEPFFQGHFPGRPIFPGVLLCEAFAQVAALVALTAYPDYRDKAVYLMGLDRFRFRHPVVPGDRLVLTVETRHTRRGVWQFDCLAQVDGERVADGGIMATITDPVEG